jgi:SAM-dependent methyltransferase
MSVDVTAYLRLAERLSSGGDSGGSVQRFYGGSGPSDAGNQVRPMHLPLTLHDQPDDAQFGAQSRLVSDWIGTLGGVATAVELGCGVGYNSYAVAAAHPAVQVLGLDLVPSLLGVARGSAQRPPNASFVAADFGRLPLLGGTADVVFAIESVGYARDMPGLLDQVRQVLRAGGRLFVIEIFRTDRFAGAPAQVTELCTATERLLAFPGLWSVPDWVALAADRGFEVTGLTDLTDAALPELRDFARVGEQALDSPAGLPDDWQRFLLVGLLVCRALQSGGHGYFAVQLTRRG